MNSTQTKHTPGPWQVAGELDNLRVMSEIDDEKACDGLRRVALVTCGDFELADYGEHAANARLIAAAPDLLAALQDAIAVGDALGDWIARTQTGSKGAHSVVKDARATLDNARAAIARATQG